jgi:uncharacterized coiled-coil DUF342 family protein
MSDTLETDLLYLKQRPSLVQMTTHFNQFVKKCQQLERERDEALSQIAQAECRAERFCQERDELIDKNKKLNEEVDDLIRQRPLLIEDFKRERDEARDELKIALEQWELCLEQIAKLKNDK